MHADGSADVCTFTVTVRSLFAVLSGGVLDAIFTFIVCAPVVAKLSACCGTNVTTEPAVRLSAPLIVAVSVIAGVVSASLKIWIVAVPSNVAVPVF